MPLLGNKDGTRTIEMILVSTVLKKSRMAIGIIQIRRLVNVGCI